MSVYFSQPCPIPYHIIHPQFFLFFSKKLHNALWKIAHIGRKYFLPLIQAQALYFIFYGEHSMNHSLILKIFSLHPPGNMRRAWHWFEAGYNETKQLYHSTNCISLYFWYIENIRYEITLGLSPLNNCIREICPFTPIFQGNNYFRVKYWKITFTFDIYLGTSWNKAKAAKESKEIFTGWWKDVFQIFGTSWMLVCSLVLVNGNIWEIFAPWRGRLLKKLFWSLLKSRVWLASVQIFNFCSHPLHVFRS